jgi:arginase
MAKITILEFPSNLGLIEPAPGQEPGVKKLPAWLKNFHFHELLRPEKVYSLSPPPYSMEVDIDSGVRNANAIVAYAKEQAESLKTIITGSNFVVVIGGDCSILIGNTLALKQNGNYGLFFLDGHTDFMWPELSGTKGAAGMDLAIVTGNGHQKLSDIYNLGPYIKEENTWCVGNREFDERYVETIAHSNVHYFDLNLLRENGIENCCGSFLKMASENKLDGFWIHLDVDVLDDELMPAVDSRSAGGINYGELKSILACLLNSEKAKGIEITILDPDLDPGGKYTKTFVNEIGGLIKKILNRPNES